MEMIDGSALEIVAELFGASRPALRVIRNMGVRVRIRIRIRDGRGIRSIVANAKLTVVMGLGSRYVNNRSDPNQSEGPKADC